MDNTTFDAQGNLEKIYSQDSLLDILIEFEGVLDSMDLYAFKNWINGEIIDGPKIERYWIKVVLKYLKEEMPDPKGGLRLIKHGSKITYTLTTEEVPVDLSEYNDENRKDAYEYDEKSGETKRKTEEVEIWLVEITMPRRFIDETEKGISITDDDDVIDLERADDAEKEGLDDETVISDEDNGMDEEEQDETL